MKLQQRNFIRATRGANRLICLVFLVSVVCCSFSRAAEFSVGSKCVPPSSDIAIDRAWGGARVQFDTLKDKDFIYVAYYDADRWLTIAQISKCTGEQRKIRVPSRFGGWDEHNSITLAFDGANRLHVSGNMHMSALVYARMVKADQLSGLDVLRPMTGVDETRATYPYFFRFADGALGFSYRSGQSGDGVELINRLEGSRWVRWVDQPLFAPSVGGKAVSAYHTDYMLGADGLFHVAWVWRATPNVETNFHVNYAKSPDLRTWEMSNGSLISLPITPASAEVVDSVPEQSGLINNIRLGFDKSGQPVISYLKFDAAGATQLFHARREKDGWKSTPATKWTYRWDPRGGGTIPSEISFSGVRVRNGRLTEWIHQPEVGTRVVAYDDASLKAKEMPDSGAVGAEISFKDRQPPKGAILTVRPVRSEGPPGSDADYHYAISWFSLPAGNRDRPRDCKPDTLPCNFTSQLILRSAPVSPRQN